ncbi:AAA family ATPase [Vulcanisaeta souniana]|nr:MoxR family ATPase [Vulcanisaeta souniana]
MIRGKIKAIVGEILGYYSGKEEVIRKILAAALAGGHVLLEDKPGVGKTFLAKLMAKVLGLQFSRIQFTPDLLPSDIVGTKVWRPSEGRFVVMTGPVFANFILADEINRAPPKTQAALLEAMEELQVTIEGETYKLPQPFIVIATQNPIEYEGTYPLPEAQMDRFMLKMSLGYPSEDEEGELLSRRIKWMTDDPTGYANTITNTNDLLAIRQFIEGKVRVDQDIIKYILAFRVIRDDERVAAGPSPRGLLSLLRIARAIAVIDGRDYVIPDDVKSVAADTLGHRIVLKPEYAIESEITGRDIVLEYLGKISVPK